MANVYDAIRTITLVLGLGTVARLDRKSWLLADSVMWGSYAAYLFVCPGSLLPGVEGGMMSYLVRVFASVLVGMESMWYLCRKTRDDNVIGAVLWTRVMGSFMMLFIMGYTYTQIGDKLTTKPLYFDFVGMVMLLVTSVYQSWRGHYHVGGREQKGHVSTLLRVNYLILLLTGLANMTYPKWVIPFVSLGKEEVMMMRVIGAGFFGLSFTAWYATSFRYDDDRSAFFLSEILTSCLMFVSLNLAYFVDGLFTPKQALLMHVGIVPALVVLLGLYLLWKKNQPSQPTSVYYTRSKTL